MNKIIDTIKNILTFNLTNKVISNISLYTIIILLIIIQSGGVILALCSSRDGYIVNLYVIIIMIILLLYTLINHIKNKKLKLSWDILVLGSFIIYSLLSALFSKDINTSLFGTVVRREGFITLFLYYLIYLNSKCIVSKKNIISFINISFGIGLVGAVVGIIQSLGNGNILHIAKLWDHMAFGFCGNPNFFGTYMMILCLLGFSLINFYKDTTLYHKICTIIFFIGLVLSSSTGPFISFCIMVIIIMLILRFKHQSMIYHNRIVGWLAIFIFLFTIFNYGNIYINNIYEQDWFEKIKEEETISGDITILSSKLINKVCKLFSGVEPLQLTSVSDENIGSGRLQVWKNTTKYMSYGNRIWFGSGPDNFRMESGYVVYYNKYTGDKSYHHIVYDRAHNVYLNYAVSTGIFSLIAYLIWTIIVNIECIKNRKDIFVLILFLFFIGYNIQSLLNINVLEVTPYYYLYTGLVMGLIVNKKENN